MSAAKYTEALQACDFGTILHMKTLANYPTSNNVAFVSGYLTALESNGLLWPFHVKVLRELIGQARHHQWATDLITSHYETRTPT